MVYYTRSTNRMETMHITGLNSTEIDEDEFYDYHLENYQYNYPGEIPADKFVNYFKTIVFPYFLLFGTIGNIVGTALMRRYSNNVWSTCLYMSIIFPMDLIKLYVDCGNEWLTTVVSSDPYIPFNLSKKILLLSNAVCKVYSFVFNVLLSEAEWIMVAVSIETAIAFKKPSWIYEMCCKERAKAIVLFISVMLISLNLHYFWTHGLVRPEDEPNIDVYYCNYANELSNKFRDYIWPIINACVEHFIPVSIVSCCCAIVVLNISRRKMENENSLLEKYFLDVKSLRQLKLAMFITCIFTLISQISNTIFKGMQYRLFELEYTSSLLTSSFLLVLTCIIASHKFWIFYICCEKFRSDVKQMTRRMCRPFRRGRGIKYPAKTNLLGDKVPEATVSWRESETSFMKVKDDPKIVE